MSKGAGRSIVMTLAEDVEATTASAFGVAYRIDEHDCLAFARALRARGLAVYYVNWNDVDTDRRVVKRAFLCNRSEFVFDVPCAQFDCAFAYKMEGFLRRPDRFFEMVSMFESCCDTVINDPATIRHNIDKRYLFELAQHGIPVIPSYRIAPAVDARVRIDGYTPSALTDLLHREGKSLVFKPLRAERGEGIVRLDVREPLEAWRESSRSIDASTNFAQEFMPSVRAGERSLVFLGHAFQHAVIKFPNPQDPDEFRCNESLGGSVAPHVPTPAELAVAARTLQVYEALGYPVHFSRIDLIESPGGPMLMEAELLNPSIYANYLGRGEAFGEAFADYVCALLAER